MVTATASLDEDQRRDVARSLRMLLDQVDAGQLDAPPIGQAYLRGVLDGLEGRFSAESV